MARRLWLAAVVLLFCAPLFTGLRNRDLENDEAIYSFAVDRILEVGEWLQPKSSPSETVVFLEKPPLKFWIVAAPIKAGLLPHDEFGLRVWDALFGSLAFVYVFGIGAILAGPVCGIVAVLILFVHPPLLFDHGIRGNNMEAALVLSYCGGVYHFLRWANGRTSHRRRHAVGAGLYFALGFMCKFVAVIFLPAIAFLPALLFKRTRDLLAAGWRDWLAAAAVAGALILPWFVYAQIAFGRELWHVMLAEHVYARFTTGLVAAHINPWHFYLSTMWAHFVDARIEWLVVAGFAVLTLQAARRRWFEGTVVLAWAVLTLGPISFGSSKLYHYAYPFLPPLALAAGYLAGLVMMLAPVQVRKVGGVLEGLVGNLPGLGGLADRLPVQRLAGGIIWAAALLAIGAFALGTVRLEIGRTLIFKSSGVLRPLLAMAIAALVSRRTAAIATLVTAIGVTSFLPLAPYRDTLRELRVERHAIRDTSECVQRVQRTVVDPPLRKGMGVDTENFMWHSLNYYFRRVRPFTPVLPLTDDTIDKATSPESPWPLALSDERYRRYREHLQATRSASAPTPPLTGFLDYVILLPGPYRACSPEARALHGAS